ncbi:hypothetical protein JKP88DRAFT_254150 [Tribonema minus]|uniref:Uncharacterized protein n=1 Tax=Tribonema minus TaxID=303371 RepID=A0A835Z5I4_9STRA|nr:hypothetical protein JKP88DRAFT_254150 [Tribonema minus]
MAVTLKSSFPEESRPLQESHASPAGRHEAAEDSRCEQPQVQHLCSVLEENRQLRIAIQKLKDDHHVVVEDLHRRLRELEESRLQRSSLAPLASGGDAHVAAVGEKVLAEAAAHDAGGDDACSSDECNIHSMEVDTIIDGVSRGLVDDSCEADNDGNARNTNGVDSCNSAFICRDAGEHVEGTCDERSEAAGGSDASSDAWGPDESHTRRPARKSARITSLAKGTARRKASQQSAYAQNMPHSAQREQRNLLALWRRLPPLQSSGTADRLLSNAIDEPHCRRHQQHHCSWDVSARDSASHSTLHQAAVPHEVAERALVVGVHLEHCHKR